MPVRTDRHSNGHYVRWIESRIKFDSSLYDYVSTPKQPISKLAIFALMVKAAEFMVEVRMPFQSTHLESEASQVVCLYNASMWRHVYELGG